MADSPLAVPQDPGVLDAFRAQAGLRGRGSPVDQLREVVAAFSQLPYENLSKIVKADACGSPIRARRHPTEVIADHGAYGAGGTCFSLTVALLHLVRALGWQAEPLLADRRYGENTHCALAVWVAGRPHLLDPGFLILDPIPLDAGHETRVPTAFNELILTPDADGGRLALATAAGGRTTYRLTFKTQPADDGQFLQAWDASFDWEMMHYPVLSRVVDGRQLYLCRTRLQSRNRDTAEHVEIPRDELVRRIAAEFGIAVNLVGRALDVLDRKGDRDG
jgi:arylamine N-acetyltransferase